MACVPARPDRPGQARSGLSVRFLAASRRKRQNNTGQSMCVCRARPRGSFGLSFFLLILAPPSTLFCFPRFSLGRAWARRPRYSSSLPPLPVLSLSVYVPMCICVCLLASTECLCERAPPRPEVRLPLPARAGSLASAGRTWPGCGCGCGCGWTSAGSVPGQARPGRAGPATTQ